MRTTFNPCHAAVFHSQKQKQVLQDTQKAPNLNVKQDYQENRHQKEKNIQMESPDQ